MLKREILAESTDLEIKGTSMDENTQGKCNFMESEEDHGKSSGKHRNLRDG